MIKRQGCWLFNEGEYVGHRFSQGCKKNRAHIEWAEKIKDPEEHTQFESGVLCLAVKKPYEINFDDKIIAKADKPTKKDLRSLGDISADHSRFLNCGGSVLAKARASGDRAVSASDSNGEDEGEEEEEEDEENEEEEEESDAGGGDETFEIEDSPPKKAKPKTATPQKQPSPAKGKDVKKKYRIKKSWQGGSLVCLPLFRIVLFCTTKSKLQINKM
jgi:hypothetical protein